MSKVYKDKPLEEFFGHGSMEMAERTGLALIEATKSTKIFYGKEVLPRVSLCRDTAFTFYFGDGPGCSDDFLREMAKEYTDEESQANIQKYLDLHNVFVRESRAALTANQYHKLSRSETIWAGGWGGHANPDFGRIVNIGTEGIRAMINECKAKDNPDSDWFYRACEYAMDAVDLVGEKCRLTALEELKTCEDPVRRERLEAAAKAFEVIPKKPAYDFTSACHAFWMIFTMDGIDSPGRFDQYMWDAYSKDTDEEAKDDVLRRLWEAFHNTRTWNLCLSGSDENWNDMTNDLTYHILKIAAERLYNTPNITLRVHHNTPEKLWQAIADTLATGIGMPALYNDDIVCPAFEKIGMPACDSHLYCMNGCNQIDIMGKSHMGLEDGEVLFCKCLEYALYNGVNPLSGELDALATGDPREFKTYEEFETAVLKQLDYATYVCCATANVHQHMRAMYSPNPLRSCLIEGCLEKGRDYRNGGPLYGHGQILAEGIADTGDSMWAVKKLVYDEKKYTMDELIKALDANFEGYEELRHDFASCEKFGNACKEVDEITAKVVNRFFTFLKRNHTYRGGVFTGGCSTFNRSAGYGRNVGALPNGRGRRDPMLADSIGAVPGNDTNGPTSLINSVLCYNHIDSGSGFVLQTKYDKKIISTQKGKEALIAIAKAYFAGGGQQFTVSVVNPEDLIDAQKNPDKYRNLIVRVGGYSDIFVNLEKGLQDNIIARTVVEV